MITSPMQADERHVLDSFWFGYIGIVKVKSGNHGEVKFYIGQGSGEDQHADEQHIARTGTPVYPQTLNLFFNT